MMERSDEGIVRVFAVETSHDSNAEKRMEVDIPPNKRPRNRTGRYGIVMQKQAKIYVMQKTRQSFLRPLHRVSRIVSRRRAGEDILLVRPYAHQRSSYTSGHEAGDEQHCNHPLGQLILFAVERVHIRAL